MRLALLLLAISILFTAPSFAQNTPQPPDRTVYLLGEITEASVTELINQLKALDKADPGQEITLEITSPGGSVYAGITLYDAIEGLSSPVRTVCEGMCASMAAVILASGHTRYASPHATIMFHQLSMGIEPSKLTICINEVEEGIRLQKTIDAILAKHSGLSLSEVRQMESWDHFMSPEEAQKLGLIDNILPTKAEK